MIPLIPEKPVEAEMKIETNKPHNRPLVTRTCVDCQLVKTSSDWYRDPRDGAAPICAECWIERLYFVILDNLKMSRKDLIAMRKRYNDKK